VTSIGKAWDYYQRRKHAKTGSEIDVFLDKDGAWDNDCVRRGWVDLAQIRLVRQFE
jgi:hypothetical protein